MPLMNPIPFPTLYHPGLHALDHAYRVLRLVQRLSALEGRTLAQCRVLEFCAIFHDIGRVHDGRDPMHGALSVEKLRRNDFFGLEEFDTPLVHYIITNHCITDSVAYGNVADYAVADREEAVVLLKTFKDADNLDRVRLGDLDARYLRHESSKGLLGLAEGLLREDVGERVVVEVFVGVLRGMNAKYEG